MKSKKLKSKLAVFLIAAFAVSALSVTLSRGAQAFAPAAAPASGFVGSWPTTWTTTDGRTVSAPILVKVDTDNPNALDGAVEVKGPNGVMYGTLSSDGKASTWAGNWWDTDGVHGSFTFTLADRTSKNFTGSYRVAGSDKDYDWHSTR